jgi:hypothetical protein
MPDIPADFAAHVEASRQAHGWAEKSLALRQAGNVAQAIAAENKAKSFLRWRKADQKFWRSLKLPRLGIV